ncbi:hypothetical protein BOX15_Mlig006264g1 [Macrostomum lignano]|uniref:TLDc domain-containing protein n=1 Tax=Macrostomum lignano TaxID=282301 RepID=A0A267EX11_9PLAT|nr:hypothetical protein BOX15_Mlig006264g1 [Macrostomum lignano]
MLLRWFDNDFKVYQATNTDGLFLRSSRHSLSVGAGALTLRADLLSGCSESSETFNSPALIDGSEFALGSVQLWAFQVFDKD